jgi:hypothetical protein
MTLTSGASSTVQTWRGDNSATLILLQTRWKICGPSDPPTHLGDHGFTLFGSRPPPAFRGGFQNGQNVKTMPGQRSVLVAPGQGLTPGPGGRRQCMRHMPVIAGARTHGQRRLSGIALVMFANIQISGTRSSRASRRCSLPPSALLCGMADGLWSQGVVEVLSRLSLR